MKTNKKNLAAAMRLERETKQATDPNLTLQSRPVLGSVPLLAMHYLALARKEAAELHRAGWQHVDTARLALLYEEFLGALNRRDQAALERKRTKEQIGALEKRTVIFSRKIAAGFKRLLQTGQAQSIPPAVLKPRKSTSSPTRAMVWLQGARETVGLLSEKLARLLPFSPSGRLAELMIGLEDAVAAQGAAKQDFDQRRKDLRALGLAVAQAIQGLRTVAQNAFAEDPAALRAFQLPRRRKARPVTPAVVSEGVVARDAARPSAANDDAVSEQRSRVA